MDLNQIYNEDCLETMDRLSGGAIDMTITSPPYDGLRTYGGYSFEFESIAQELYRVTKTGGVVVWIVNDSTIKGSETGTSFRQALFFKDVGFRLHDTMIWYKPNPIPGDPRQPRYTSSFEYMFILAKGRPITGNLLREKCKRAGACETHSNPSQRKANGAVKTYRVLKRANVSTQQTKIRHNVWTQPPNAAKYLGHPAVYPLQLIKDHIATWSNPGDLVYDPFMGSGTTAVAAWNLGRSYLGSEICAEYVDICKQRLAEVQADT